MIRLNPNLSQYLQDHEGTRIGASTLQINQVSHPLAPQECDECGGSGKTLYGSLHGAVFTHRDMEEDPEFFQDMNAGEYDVPCSVCRGAGYLMVLLDCPENQALLTEVQAIEKAEAEYQREVDMERRMLGEI